MTQHSITVYCHKNEEFFAKAMNVSVADLQKDNIRHDLIQTCVNSLLRKQGYKTLSAKYFIYSPKWLSDEWYKTRGQSSTFYNNGGVTLSGDTREITNFKLRNM